MGAPLDQSSAAYTPPLGMKSLELKLMENGEPGTHLDPEWAEVRVIMRERDELRRLAAPLARLPLPVSSDERVDWLTHQQKLKEALDALD